MFDRPASEGNRAVLVQLDFGAGGLAERLAEFQMLAGSAGAETVAIIQGRRKAPDPALYAGSGKVDEIAAEVLASGADIVIFNHELSAGQQRNLERVLQRRVIDRTTLILDIFALRAKSHEGKLQVELAQLEHLATRLVRGWTHLERQKGGIGLRGPGEKQLETDRRLLGKRVALLKERLRQLEKQRKVRRRSRERSEVPVVSLVGYTNAGKSTLFNALCKAGAYAADQLFATLDTTSRRVYLHDAQRHMVLSDTVGFIRDLPHSVVAAFHATLEETAQADLLLHVVDASSADREAQIDVVNEVLAEIGAGDVPQILVWNKIDMTHGVPTVEEDGYGKIERILLSARTGEGLDLLRNALARQLFPIMIAGEALGPPASPMDDSDQADS
ncbi:GTPase HflX [Uliginosibacterium aquaticum]|uniref:GTPase HflX n=1 Tax=Uliginosibacterium aquaticum TaxID=2731212 RepID=A0ABX2IIY6_9RHOO|nr:GTPase HflX [Uliginosibacterium aquaticum]NSL54010.1 GTPase HflX [Uliginosibacterium aquaticum]